MSEIYKNHVGIYFKSNKSGLCLYRHPSKSLVWLWTINITFNPFSFFIGTQKFIKNNLELEEV